MRAQQTSMQCVSVQKTIEIFLFLAYTNDKLLHSLRTNISEVIHAQAHTHTKTQIEKILKENLKWKKQNIF